MGQNPFRGGLKEVIDQMSRQTSPCLLTCKLVRLYQQQYIEIQDADGCIPSLENRA